MTEIYRWSEQPGDIVVEAKLDAWEDIDEWIWNNTEFDGLGTTIKLPVTGRYRIELSYDEGRITNQRVTLLNFDRRN